MMVRVIFCMLVFSAAFMGDSVLSFNNDSIGAFRSENVMIKRSRHNLRAESSAHEIAYVEKLAASFNSSWLDEPEVIAAFSNLTEGAKITLPNLGRVRILFPHSHTSIDGGRDLLFGGCYIDGKASCHNTEGYDDYRWDTYLTLKRTPDSWTANAGWSKTPSLFSFLVYSRQSLSITVTCEQTGAARTKWPYFKDINLGLEEMWPGKKRASRVTADTTWFCYPMK
jgi:hypothetical protein